MAIRRALVGGLSAALAVAGCSGSGSQTFGGSDGGDGPSGPAIAAACADLAAASCAKRMACAPNGLMRIFGSMDVCKTRVALMCADAVMAPHSGNNPTLVEACVADYPAYSCADFVDNRPPADCAPKGPLAAGAACAFNGQCASGFCAGDKNAACGTCGDPPPVASACTSTTCDHGQECVASTNLCQVPGAPGASCDAGHLCDLGLVCTGLAASTSGAPATPGTCQTAAATLGAPCGGTMPGCDGVLGLFCGGAVGAKTCMAVTFATDGTPCGDLSNTAHVACSAGSCYTATGLAASGDTGTCKADVAEGSACDDVLGPGCLAPARCVTTGGGSAGTCTLPAGATCG